MLLALLALALIAVVLAAPLGIRRVRDWRARRPTRRRRAPRGFTSPRAVSSGGRRQMSVGDAVTLCVRVGGGVHESPALVLASWHGSPRNEIGCVVVRAKIAGASFLGRALDIGQVESWLRLPHVSFRSEGDDRWWK